MLGKRVKAPLNRLEEAKSQEQFLTPEGRLPKDLHPIYLPNTMTEGIELMPAPLDESSILQAMETSSMPPPTDLNEIQSSVNLQANISMLDVLGITSQQGPNSMVSDLSFQDLDFMSNKTFAQAYGNWEGL